MRYLSYSPYMLRHFYLAKQVRIMYRIVHRVLHSLALR